MKKLANVKKLFAVSLLGFGLVACGQNAETKNESAQDQTTTSSIEQIKKNGVVRIGVFSDKPPFGYLDEKGQNQGFDVGWCFQKYAEIK